MIINSIEFKNIKSYGNKLQKVTFDTEGKLILLTGTNGSGKSTIIDSIDLALFNQVRGKETSKIPLKYFPNRLNKELYVGINFYNNDNDLIEIERRLQPSEFNIIKNNEPFTERFRVMSEEERHKVIGFNYNTFKTFISLSMNDFSNFIKLEADDKKNLLDRLFNLEDITSYSVINNELIYQNNKEIDKLSSEITNINRTIKDYSKIIKDKKELSDNTKDSLKIEILSKNELYETNKNEYHKESSIISDLLVTIQENKNSIHALDGENNIKRTELNSISEKIKLYQGGVCPHCESNLDDSKHKDILSELVEKSAHIKKRLLDNDDVIKIKKDIIQEHTKTKNIIENEKISILNETMQSLKNEIIILKHKYKELDEDGSIVTELKDKGSKLISERKVKEERITKLIEDNKTLSKLKDILGENGVKHQIISSLVPPINKSLSKMLDKINYPYMVVLDAEFDAKIYDKGNLVYPEIMSNGELKMLNLCIAISYIEMVRKMTNINILFMDEVFQSIHKDNINLILDLLKTFSKENDINLILVHHGLEEVDPKIFDKIISVEKEMFSDIKIIERYD